MKNPRAALDKLCKWRTVFAGWQLGTRADTDPECQAVRDHRELTIVLRVEMTALSALLIEKGVISAEEFMQAMGDEAEQLDRDYERRFPGFKATPIGMQIDPVKAQQTMKGWRP